jgi:hypothetical protein
VLAKSLAATTIKEQRKIGSLVSSWYGPDATFGPSATSASRFATSTPISWLAATPAEISSRPRYRARNASSSGPATNSAMVDVVTTRSCSGAPCASRTTACASAPSATICEAVPSSRVPPGVRIMPPGDRMTS